MKRIKYFLLALMSTILISACGPGNSNEIRIIATMFPQYSLADELAGDLATVEFILPIGSDPHDFEPTPSQIVRLNQASLIIYSSHVFEPWMESIESSSKAELLELAEVLGEDSHGLVNVKHGLDLPIMVDEDHDHEEDPHFWVDPEIALLILEVIYEQLIILLPEHELLITSRKIIIEESLVEAIELYENLVAPGESLDIVFAGHNAFGYLEHYDIHIVSPYPGFSSSVLPTPQSVSQFINLMTQMNTKYLYVSETDNLSVVQALKEAFPQIETITIYTLENVTLETMNNKSRYQELLWMNYEAFARSE
jgi:zinc transport system substrate-binding protein